MEAGQIKNYISGEWVQPSGTEIVYDENPVTGEVLARFRHLTSEDVKEAVNVAKDAFGRWSKTPLLNNLGVCSNFTVFSKKIGRNCPESLSWQTQRNT